MNQDVRVIKTGAGIIRER